MVKYSRFAYEKKSDENTLFEGASRKRRRALEFGPDHVHLFLGNCKKYSVPQVAQYFKGASSRELSKKYLDRFRGS